MQKVKIQPNIIIKRFLFLVLFQRTYSKYYLLENSPLPSLWCF